MIRDRVAHQQGRLLFVKLPTTTKTRRWDVHCNGTRLGQVRWWSHWRRYTFEPTSGTIFDAGCLTDLATFLTEVTAEHKRAYVDALRSGGRR